MSRRWLSKVAFVGAVGLSALHAGQPAQADPLAVVAGQSLDVQAEKLDVNIAEGTALLEGDVHVTLGELQVACAKVEIRYDEAPQVKWARGSGGVTAKLRGIEAKAKSLEVDVAGKRLTMSGDVRLSRGKGWVEAEKASINIVTQKVTLEGVRGQIPVETPAH
ncbi:MAG: LptA/OstA family protein [Polyangiaceae bacterium]|nr:LptA/OstA family protein [Polyangiaceae bacterium]